MILTVLIILFVLALAGGGWGYSNWGYAGMSPAAIVGLILLVLLFTGHFHG